MTDVETWAAILTGCLVDDDTDVPFCAVHDEDGNPPWAKCRWAKVAEALRAAHAAGAAVERERLTARALGLR